MRAFLLHPAMTFLLGGVLVLGAMLHWDSQQEVGDTTDIKNVLNEQRELADEWSLVSPLLSCGYETEQPSTKQIIETRDAVQGIIVTARASGKVTDASVYVRMLNDGAWFGIDEKARFTPGSLLKVPLALSLMRVAEHDASFATGTYAYPDAIPNISTAFPPERRVELGKEYTFTELLELSLAYSDNVATIMLAQLIDRPTLDAAYSDLGIEVPGTGDTYTSTVRTYASFFRILYNGTYLSHKSSQYVLSILTKSSFKQGIVAGLPEGAIVAHKFGEREHAGELSQLHDCGIVYTEQPYVVCVMLRGSTISVLPEVIADISREVYEGTSKK